MDVPVPGGRDGQHIQAEVPKGTRGEFVTAAPFFVPVPVQVVVLRFSTQFFGEIAVLGARTWRATGAGQVVIWRMQQAGDSSVKGARVEEVSPIHEKLLKKVITPVCAPRTERRNMTSARDGLGG